jgi:hypothetical protein
VREAILTWAWMCVFVGAPPCEGRLRSRPQKPSVLPPSPSAGVDAAQDVAKRLWRPIALSATVSENRQT